MDLLPSFAPPDIGGNSFADPQNDVSKSLQDDTYGITSTNWYKSLPYGFAFFDVTATSGGKATSTVWLPIAPSNLTVTTNFATNIITTLYGIVEEHSEVRYYDITIQGTTGFSPRFVQPFGPGAKQKDLISQGRDYFKKTGIDLGGFLPEVTNTINSALNLVNDIANPGGQANTTGVSADKSGYVAFHNLYRSFLKYKKDAAMVVSSTSGGATSLGGLDISAPQADKPKRKVHPIQFLNYKDGVKYDCVPLSFTMVRSAENPMLYNYAIKLRAFNLRNVNAKIADADQLDKLGLGGLEGQSLFGKITSVVGNAATLIGGLL